MNIYQAVVEILFLLDIVCKFFLEFLDEATNKPVRDIKKIRNRYLGD